MALTLLDDVPLLADLPVVSAFERACPVPDGAAVAAGLVVLFGLYRLARVVRLHNLVHRAFQAVCASSPADELVVVADEEPHAMAIPAGRSHPGHILVSSGMLTALAADECAAMLAHERAHLRGRHHIHRAVADGAAAVNPLLRPTRQAVMYLVERCADESAAATVGSRTLAARSLARAALATAPIDLPGPLCYERLRVSERVVALRTPHPPRRRLIAAGLVVLGLLTAVAAVRTTFIFVELASLLFTNLR
jgi:Zn-dependent protease with chaperone function